MGRLGEVLVWWALLTGPWLATLSSITERWPPSSSPSRPGTYPVDAPEDSATPLVHALAEEPSPLERAVAR